MKKRGQTTTFIVIGLLLLITVAMLGIIRGLYFKTTETQIERIQDQPTTLPPLKTYVETCIRDSAATPIENIGIYGGSFDDNVFSFVRNPVQYKNEQYYPLCRYEQDKGCVNYLLTRDVMEEQLSKNIAPRVDSCINLTVFRDIGYDVTSGSLSFNATVAVDNIDLVLKYPIRIVKQGDIQEEDTYKVSIPNPLGRMYDLAVNITNAEIDGGFFDKDRWMLMHGSEIRIEKHRPYPNIIYKLSAEEKSVNKNYSFMFAIEGRNINILIGKSIKFKESSDQYCFSVDDSNCYINPPGNCEDYGLAELGDANECTGLTTYGPPTQGIEHCYEGSRLLMKHGESRCLLDGSGAIEGSERVGSRYTLQTCVNGVIYNEQCADYREEYCTFNRSTIPIFEYNLTLGSKKNYTVTGKGMCKPNRWQDCMEQITQTSCIDDAYRDCIWYQPPASAKIVPMCLPRVSPAFRFWELQGMDVCELGNGFRYCDGLDFSCPIEWTNSLEYACGRLGDCGNNFNIKNDLTTFGFLSSDDRVYDKNDPVPNERTRYYTPIQDNITLNPVNITQKYFDRIDLTGDELSNQDHKYTDLIEFMSDYVQEASHWDICGDWFDCDGIGSIQVPRKYVGYVAAGAACMPWQAPQVFEDMLCLKCMENNTIFPCTEYKCKSLGAGCTFSIDTQTGDGFCTNMVSDLQNFNITITGVSLPYSYQDYVDTYLASRNYLGVDIFLLPDKPLEPNTYLEISFDTSQDTMCTFLPYPPSMLDNPFLQKIPFFSSSESSFSKQHTIPITLPDMNEIVNTTMEYLNLSDYLEVLAAMEDLETYLGKNQALATILNESGYNITDAVSNFTAFSNMYVVEMEMVNQLLTELAANDPETSLFMFLMCQTPSGQVNSDATNSWFNGLLTYPFFDYVRINVDPDPNDVDPPVIVRTEPEQEGNAIEDPFILSLFLNEPAECRYSAVLGPTTYFKDFGEGDQLSSWVKPMNCTPAGVNSIIGNRCTAQVSGLGAGQTKDYYIICRDNPRIFDSYGFRSDKKNLLQIPPLSIVTSRNYTGHRFVSYNATTGFLTFRNAKYINAPDTLISYGSNYINYVYGPRIHVSRSKPPTCLRSHDFYQNFWEWYEISSPPTCGINYCNFTSQFQQGPGTKKQYIYCMDTEDILQQNEMTQEYVLTVNRQ